MSLARPALQHALLATSEPPARAPVVTDAAGGAAAPQRVPTFEELYEAWHDSVYRWVRALGGTTIDRDDVTQDVFVAAQRKLREFDGRNPAGWLFRITKNRVIDHQRSGWFKHVLSRRPETPLDEVPTAHDAHPGAELESRERRRVLFELLDRLSEKKRTVFVLFEIEGYSGDEIAALEGIPVNTVWTRLHHARREFFAQVRRFQERQGKGWQR